MSFLIKITFSISDIILNNNAEYIFRLYYELLYFIGILCMPDELWLQCSAERVVLPGTHRSARRMRLKSWHANLSFMFYLSKFHTKQYFVILVIGFINRWSFIDHALLLGTSNAFTLSAFLPGECVHVLLPGTRGCFSLMIFFIFKVL